MVRKSPRKISRKSPRKTLKQRRKTLRKSPRKTSRKSPRKTSRKRRKTSRKRRKTSRKRRKTSRKRRKSPRKTSRKSPRKTSRKSRKTSRKKKYNIQSGTWTDWVKPLKKIAGPEDFKYYQLVKLDGDDISEFSAFGPSRKIPLKSIAHGYVINTGETSITLKPRLRPVSPLKYSSHLSARQQRSLRQMKINRASQLITIPYNIIHKIKYFEVKTSKKRPKSATKTETEPASKK